MRVSREEALNELRGTAFDVLIVGGGINGAGVARDAALRGLKVCLLEQGDFASGTSSKSTKIAHGGLRYLRNFEIGLVRESQRERLRLRRQLPHLVKPQSFCYPVYKDGADPLWKVRLGVGFYTLLAGFRERSRRLSAAETLTTNPHLRPHDLDGSVRYWDDRMDDARVCLETVLSAEESGATCLNYVRVHGIVPQPSGFEAGYQDIVTGATGTVSARTVCNCAGPWSDQVRGLLGDSTRMLRPTKGVHIVVPRIESADALILDNPDDNRTFFAIPWDGFTLIGTTDTRYDGDPGRVQVDAADIDYLLDAANHYLPGARLTGASILHSFAGLRPLVAPASDDLVEGKISRRHLVRPGPPGVVTVLGGKFTTFRQMTQEATDALVESLGFPHRTCITAGRPYFEARGSTIGFGEQPALWQSLEARYGPRAADVYDICASTPQLGEPVIEGQPVRMGELVFALLEEHAVYLDDLWERRTMLSWTGRRPEEALNGRLTALTAAGLKLRDPATPA